MMKKLSGVLSVGMIMTAGATGAEALQYPQSPRGSLQENYFGTSVPAPYRWLEDLDAPATGAWVRAQNALSLPFLKHLPERETFGARLTELWSAERYGVPVRAGDAYLLQRNDGLQNQSVLYLQDGLHAEPRLLLDPNRLSADGTVALTQYTASPDGRWLVYGTAASGSDWNVFRIRSLQPPNQELPETLRRIKFSDAVWTQDSAGFFYARYPTPAQQEADGSVFDDLASQKIYYHRLGTPQAEDVLIFEQPRHPKWFLDVSLGDQGRYLLISARQGSGDQNQVYLLDLQDPQRPVLSGTPRQLVGSFEHSYTLLGSQGTTLYLLTNHDAPQRRIIAMDLHRPAPEYWREVVPESADTIEAARLAGGELVVLSLHDAASRLQRYALSGEPLGPIALPGLGAIDADNLHARADSSELFFGFTSFNRPLAVYRVDLRRGEPEVFRKPRLAFDPDDFVTEQVFYPSRDGTRIPMFISYRRGQARKPTTPVFLHGYGGFDIAKTPAFDASALSWMERGGIYAVANLRGGGEYGQAWHEAGTRERKQNVFDDFYYAGRYLVEQGYTRPQHIAIWGRSNGGLLVGASINQHPDFWGAAVATVGVMDMLRFHKFTVGFAWTGDYGSADTPEGYAYLSAYSPLHTLKPGTAYPPTLITTGDHDDRVHPAHSYKYAAALQAAQAGANPVLIRIDMDAGHGGGANYGGKPTDKVIAEEADKLAFMWHYTTASTAGRNSDGKRRAAAAGGGGVGVADDEL